MPPTLFQQCCESVLLCVPFVWVQARISLGNKSKSMQSKSLCVLHFPRAEWVEQFSLPPSLLRSSSFYIFWATFTNPKMHIYVIYFIYIYYMYTFLDWYNVYIWYSFVLLWIFWVFNEYKQFFIVLLVTWVWLFMSC